MAFHGSRVVRVCSVYFAGAMALCPGGAEGQTMLPPKELKEAARGIVEREHSSVVWVAAKVRLRKQSDGSAVAGKEAVLEVLGTIVEESGLTVVSDSRFRPEKALAPAAGAAAAAGGGDAVAEFSFIEIVLGEDITVPASVVYRDRDLDLAFLKPDEKIAKQRGAKFRPVDVASGHSLEVMDDVVHVSRLGRSMDRAPSVLIGNVSSVVRATRTFYGTTSEVTPGAPVYSADGSLLGIGVYRIVDGAPTAPVTLSSETVKVISEIAEATGFLAAKSEGMGTSLTEGLTLAAPESIPAKGAPAVAPPAAKEPVPKAEPKKPAPAAGLEAAVAALPSGSNIRTVPQPKEKPMPAPAKIVGAEAVPTPAPAPPAPKLAPEPKKPAAKPNADAPAVAEAAVDAPEGAAADPAVETDAEKRGLKGFLGKIKFQSRRQSEKEEKEEKGGKEASKETEKPVVLEPAPPAPPAEGGGGGR